MLCLKKRGGMRLAMISEIHRSTVDFLNRKCNLQCYVAKFQEAEFPLPFFNSQQKSQFLLL